MIKKTMGWRGAVGEWDYRNPVFIFIYFFAKIKSETIMFYLRLYECKKKKKIIEIDNFIFQFLIDFYLNYI